MKRLLLVTAAISSIHTAAAFATVTDVTGTVNVTGSVAAKCVVTDAGASGTTPATLGDTIALGELAGADGTLLSTLSGSTSGAPAGGITKNFRVNCNTGAPKVTLTATSLSNPATAVTGYSNAVNYTAGLDVDQANSSTASFTYNTGTAAGTGTSPLASPLKNATSNVRVKVYGLNTTTGNLLVAGNYAGVVTVTINNN